MLNIVMFEYDVTSKARTPKYRTVRLGLGVHVRIKKKQKKLQIENNEKSGYRYIQISNTWPVTSQMNDV